MEEALALLNMLSMTSIPECVYLDYIHSKGLSNCAP